MNRHLRTIGMIIFLILGLSSFSFSQEQLTITTYYPSPYGSYKELRADQIAIGSAYRDPSANPLTDGNLIVSGNVGIGTVNPEQKLHIAVPNSVDSILQIEREGPGGRKWGFGVSTFLDSTGAFFIADYTGLQIPVTIEINGGNVGIGTTIPSERLDVSGNVRVSGGYRQSGTGGEVLRIIRGRVASNGSVLGGSGFTSFHAGTGLYLITFLTPFSTSPMVVATVFTDDCRVATLNTVPAAGTGFSAIIRKCGGGRTR